MWFKNKQTGHTWEILDEKLQQELLKKPHFEVVESPKSKTSKQDNQKFECDICGKEFKSDKAVNAHIRMAHKEGEK